MQVLITTGLYPPEIGGPATHAKYLAEGLPRHGYMVDILPFRTVRKYWPIVRHVVFFFLILTRARHTDVLYAQDTVSVGVPTALAGFFLGKKCIVRIPGDHTWEQGTRRFGITEPLEDFPQLSWKWHPFLILMRLLQLWVVGRAHAVVVPSRYMQGIVRRWGIEKKKSVLIYNGVEVFANTGNKLVLRGLIKFQGKLLISIGRLVPWKGFLGLIRLLPKLRKEFPDLKLLIAGGGSLLAELEAEASRLGLENDVIFTGELERDVLVRYIRTADVFVLNSRYEGLSHQMLEVMSVGVPVIATKVGGNPEVIEDGKNGYLVRPDDTEHIVSRVSGLLKNAALRATLVASAKRTARQFSNERMIEETAKLLKKICAS